MKVDCDFKLDVFTDRFDSIRRLVLAQKIFFASFEEPKVSFINFLKNVKWKPSPIFCCSSNIVWFWTLDNVDKTFRDGQFI